MKAWKKDLYLSISLLIFCAASYLYCEAMPPGMQKFTLAHAGRYVQFWLVILTFLSLALLITTLIKKPQELVSSAWNKLVVFTLAALIAYLFLLPHLGFSVTTCLFILVLVYNYNQSNPEKRLSGKSLKITVAKWILFSIGFTFVLLLLFTKILKVILPSLGILGI